MSVLFVIGGASRSGKTLLADLDVVHDFLANESYWARGRSREAIETAVRNSLNFSLIHDSDGLVGFARVVTDYATFGWVADVFVLAPHRGEGLGQWLIDCVFAHPRVCDLARLWLGTDDAQGFYAKHGFTQHSHPERVMVRPPVDSFRAL